MGRLNFIGADGGESVDQEEVEGPCASQRKIAAKPFALSRCTSRTRLQMLEAKELVPRMFVLH